ncbi:MAG: GntR family transcriptional regulator [Lentisphaerae bacterium]|nr:GntR family transcriptional regulator [Lentisphaerota bacterium]
MARYPEITAIIKQRIDNGVYPDKLPSLQQLALEFQVNINTIQRVMSELKKISYVYSINGVGNFAAVNRQHTSRKIVSLYMNNFIAINNSRLINFIGALQQGLLAHDLKLQLIMNDDLPDPATCQAVLIHAWSIRGKNLQKLQEHIMPEKIYFIDRFVRNEQLFAIDNAAAGQMAIDYLYSLGHRNIAVLAYSLVPEISFYERACGAARAAEKYPDLNWKIHDFGNTEDTKNRSLREQHFHEIIFQKSRPDAVFVLTDKLALHFIQYCRSNNISVPDDISVIGYDNEMMLQFFEPALTTFEEPYKQLAAELVKRVLRPIRRPGEALQVFLKPTLIERSSVKKLN